jgi:biotin--protein ligase
VSIKWPNDIYAGGLKIGGALIHTTWQGDRFSVLAGIGLNVANRAPTTCLEEVVARQAAAAARGGGGGESSGGGGGGGGGDGGGGGSAPVRIPRGAVLAHVLNHLEACYDEFEASGFAGLEAAYLGAWMHSGQVVDVEEGAVIAPAGGGGGGPPVAGDGGGRVRLTIAGLSEHGFLLARDELGGRWELTPDGNSLDMLVGLIRRKLPG